MKPMDLGEKTWSIRKGKVECKIKESLPRERFRPSLVSSLHFTVVVKKCIRDTYFIMYRNLCLMPKSSRWETYTSSKMSIMQKSEKGNTDFYLGCF